MTAQKTLDTGFPALARHDAQILILGSMPGVASLQQQQYYAHPRNAFWPMMHRVFNWPETLNYAQRCTALMAEQIAVWDVLQRCHRPGSLDSRIDPTSIQINNFQDFFAQHRHLQRICFNGRTAQQLFMRHVAGQLASLPETILLPSTSPAHASLTFEAKQARWLPALTQC